MNKAEIKAYQDNIKPWQPKADVTMEDVVIHGIVDECVTEANKAINRIIGKDEK